MAYLTAIAGLSRTMRLRLSLCEARRILGRLYLALSRGHLVFFSLPISLLVSAMLRLAVYSPE